MIFLDSNVPMYLVGAPHPNKDATRRILERLIAAEERLVTDVEVIQEILHRYTAIRRRDAVGPCVDALLELADEVFAVEVADALRARGLVMAREERSARAAIHAAVMERRGVRRIVSFDGGFDALEGVERICD